MDEKIINELIEQLTRNLENVESAREQVENTVQAYATFKGDVSKYTSELNFIAQNVRTMISQLEEIKEKFLGKFSIRIVDEISSAVTAITKAIDEVVSQITSLQNLTESKAEQINKNVKQRMDFIDTTLSSIRTEISSMDSKIVDIKTKLDQLSSTLQAIKAEESKHYNAIIKQLEEQENRLNTEFDVVRKQNVIFSVINIVLLCIILGLLILGK